jgi:hypothetical protein
VDGVLKQENGTSLVISVADQGDRAINKSDVAERSTAVSAMPPMGALLAPSQIRDVVEFLAGQ